MERCSWCESNDLLREYHDNEWGVPLHDDRLQFEFLMLEVMQCGLSWGLILKKREIFRSCFDMFDYDLIAEYGEDDILRILAHDGMIRSRRKTEAVINNARRFKEIRNEFGSFSKWLWSFTKGDTLLYAGHQIGMTPTKNALSDRISAELKKRGFKYLGSVTVYSHLEACGIINDHTENCFRYSDIIKNYTTRKVNSDDEL